MILVCPVRGCGLPLAAGERAFACARRHSFDVAKSGYLNLLQPQDKRSPRAGDSKEAIRARGRLLERGLGAPLLEAIAGSLADAGAGAGRAVLDVGCGDGYFLAALAERFDLSGAGVDLSTFALAAAAKRAPGLSWIAANADRRLPFADGSFDCALSITGPKNAAELRRIVQPAGRVLVAVPAADDLAELRKAILGRAIATDRVPRMLEIFGAWFAPGHRETVRSRVRLHAPEIRDLLASTYRGARRREQERAATLTEIDVTLSYEVQVFAPLA